MFRGCKSVQIHMASQFASQHHQVHYLTHNFRLCVISQAGLYPCVCSCLSVIPYASQCRLYSLLHLICNTQPNRVAMVCCVNQMKKLHQKKYSKPWIFFWTMLCQLRVLILKWCLVSNKLIADLFLYRGTAKQHFLISHYLCCIYFHHPWAYWNAKPLPTSSRSSLDTQTNKLCILKRVSRCIFWGSSVKVNVPFGVNKAGRQTQQISIQRKGKMSSEKRNYLSSFSVKTLWAWLWCSMAIFCIKLI